jgi:exopolysaccharide biosynthesis protein
MNSYISFGIIPAAKAAIGYNASGFYVKGAWEPPSDYYNNRSGSWLVLTDGKLTRSRITEDGAPTKTIIGINPSGDLKIYNGVSNASARQTVYNSVMADQIKNTWSFGPVLVKNGTAVSTDTTQAKRQAICQVNSNNYIMLTTIYNSSYDEMAKLFVSLGCKTAFNFDGGGSTSLFYKKPGTTGVTKLKCSDGSTHDQCRAIVEGIYFIEK